MAQSTTIRINPSVKGQLDGLKNFGRESYEEVIERLINLAEGDEEITESEIKQIEASLEDLKNGRVLPLKEAEKKWGI